MRKLHAAVLDWFRPGLLQVNSANLSRGNIRVLLKARRFEGLTWAIKCTRKLSAQWMLLNTDEVTLPGAFLWEPRDAIVSVLCPQVLMAVEQSWRTTLQSSLGRCSTLILRNVKTYMFSWSCQEAMYVRRSAFSAVCWRCSGLYFFYCFTWVE